MKYKFFVAGKTRNIDKLQEVLRMIRANKKTAWCFIEKAYFHGADAKLDFDAGGDSVMEQFEKLTLQDELVKQIFDDDLEALRNSENFVLVLPAGTSGHMEAGIAFGMGKKCYAIGVPEKTESLYHIFDRIFTDEREFENFLSGSGE